MSRKLTTALRSTAKRSRAKNLSTRRISPLDELVDEDLNLFHEYDRWNEPRKKWFARAQKFLHDVGHAAVRSQQLSRAEIKGIQNLASSYQRRLAEDALVVAQFALRLTELRHLSA